MSPLDDIKNSANSILATVGQLQAPPPVQSVAMPPPVDCLAGTVPPIPGMNAAEQNIDYYNGRCGAFDRMQPGIAGGAILCIGDSNIECLDVSQIHPACINMGIGGDTIRGVMNRLQRHSAIRRAGAVVLNIGLNDVCWDAPQNPPYCFDLLAPWITGKWVINKVMHINEALFPQYAGLNAKVDSLNAHLVTLFAGRADVALVDINSQLGNADYSDGMHLTASGQGKLRPAIAAALHSLGVI